MQGGLLTMGFFLADHTPADWQAMIHYAGHRGVHNFSFGCIAAYFGLLDGKVDWIDDCVLHVITKQGRHKTWVFIPKHAALDVRHRVAPLQKHGPVYSQMELPLTGTQSAFREITYDLNRVFDPSSYPSRKKRYQRLTYPPRWMEAHDFELEWITPRDLPEIKALHDEWVEHKLAQPGTYQIMFPRSRYYNCCRLAAESPEWFLGIKITDESGAIAGVRVLYREGEWAFDLAQFARPGLLGDASEHFAIQTMRTARDEGVRWINCGASLNSSLAGFKHHWPHEEVTHWAYSQIKE